MSPEAEFIIMAKITFLENLICNIFVDKALENNLSIKEIQSRAEAMKQFYETRLDVGIPEMYLTGVIDSFFRLLIEDLQQKRGS